LEAKAELQIEKNSCQTLGPASKRVLPDLSTFCQTYFGCIEKQISGMSLEAGNRRKSPVTLAVTTGYFFSLNKKMRENLSSNTILIVSVRVIFIIL
jgi:hypothetical protein